MIVDGAEVTLVRTAQQCYRNQTRNFANSTALDVLSETNECMQMQAKKFMIFCTIIVENRVLITGFGTG